MAKNTRHESRICAVCRGAQTAQTLRITRGQEARTLHACSACVDSLFDRGTRDARDWLSSTRAWFDLGVPDRDNALVAGDHAHTLNWQQH